MNVHEQATADRTSMAAAWREAQWMDIAFDNQRGAARVDDAMRARIAFDRLDDNTKREVQCAIAHAAGFFITFTSGFPDDK